MSEGILWNSPTDILPIVVTASGGQVNFENDHDLYTTIYNKAGRRVYYYSNNSTTSIIVPSELKSSSAKSSYNWSDASKLSIVIIEPPPLSAFSTPVTVPIPIPVHSAVPVCPSLQVHTQLPLYTHVPVRPPVSAHTQVQTHTQAHIPNIPHVQAPVRPPVRVHVKNRSSHGSKRYLTSRSMLSTAFGK